MLDQSAGRPRLLRRGRGAIVGLTILAALLLPATALANHIFSDVPTGMTGHAAIEAIYDAGITGGCGGTRYCPTDAVTRAQMALFMQRGFSRLAYAPSVDPTVVTSAGVSVNQMLVETPGGAGKSQFVKVDAGLNLEVTGTTGCPCTVLANIRVGTAAPVSKIRITISDTGWVSVPLTFATKVATNSDLPVDVFVEFDPNGATPAINAYADITVITAPFGSSGTDVLGASN